MPLENSWPTHFDVLEATFSRCFTELLSEKFDKIHRKSPVT